MTKIRTTKVTIKTIASIILNLLSNFLQSLQRDILKTIKLYIKILKKFNFISKHTIFEITIFAKILKTKLRRIQKWLYLQWDIPHPQRKMLS